MIKIKIKGLRLWFSNAVVGRVLRIGCLRLKLELSKLSPELAELVLQYPTRFVGCKLMTMKKQSLAIGFVVSCTTSALLAQSPVGDQLTRAMTQDDQFISWREHLIDDSATAGFSLTGSDGLVVGDIDLDGFEDIVSVHEADATYDSASFLPGFVPKPEGHVRIAFGSADASSWVSITIAEGTEAPAPEDVDIGDVNGDGYLDVIVATERSHLIYLQNPGAQSRTEIWPRLILPMTLDKGSYIRVFMADYDGDGIPELSAANKGAQTPGPEDFARSTDVSIFKVDGDPLQGENWTEIVLGRYSVPQNAEPVDLDGDGDLDIVAASRGEQRLIFFENLGGNDLQFQEHAIGINGAHLEGFNLEYADLSGDGKLDILSRSSSNVLYWIEQPQQFGDAWNAFVIGDFRPDWMIGLETADIDGDGDTDVMAGGYSRGPRTGDGDVDVDDVLGRIGWFENPGDAKIAWTRHDISRRKRGMFDKFVARDIDGDGDVDFYSTRGNSAPYDGVFWLEQVRTNEPVAAFRAARAGESAEMALP